MYYSMRVFLKMSKTQRAAWHLRKTAWLLRKVVWRADRASDGKGMPPPILLNLVIYSAARVQ